MSGLSGWDYNRFDEFEKSLTEGKKECEKCEKEPCECDDKDDKKKKSKKTSGAKPDYLDVDKDGDKEEDMEDAIESSGGISEGLRHRDAKTGEVTDKPEIGKTYYTDGPRQKSSVALRKEKEAAEKKSGRSKSMKEAYMEMYGLGKIEEAEEVSEAAPAIAGKILSGIAKATAGAAVEKLKSRRATSKSDEKNNSKPAEETEADCGCDSKSVEEGYKPTPFEKMERQAGKAYKKEQDAVRKGDEDEANKQMKRRGAMGSPLGRRTELINQGKGPANEKTRKARSKSMKEAYSDVYGEETDIEKLDSLLEMFTDEELIALEEAAKKSHSPEVKERAKNIKKIRSNRKRIAGELGSIARDGKTSEESLSRMSKAAEKAGVRPDHMSKLDKKALKIEDLQASGLFSEDEIEALLERNAEVEAQGKKIASLEKEGRAKGLTDKFRQEHPGSREEKKERGSKKSEGDVQADQRKFSNDLQAKYGRTEKQKKEASIMAKHHSARD